MVVGELAHERDLVIIGGGPGGYHAAIRAAQLGKSVTLIEKSELGGICLNKGCIPSKVLTHSAEKLSLSQDYDELGLEGMDFVFNMTKLVNYKNKVVEQLRKGVEALCQANKIEVLTGNAFFLTDHTLGVENGDKYDIYSFTNAIIATGSKPDLPELVTKLNSNRIYNPWTITSIEEIPERLLIYGSDYISLEMAMCFKAFGAEVTLILESDDFQFDESISRELSRILKKEKIKVIKGARLIDASNEETEICLSILAKGEIEKHRASHVLFSIGNKANTTELGLERVGIQVNNNDGFIVTNEHSQTTLSHIYAVGDITGGPQLAVKAIKQGKVAAERIAGLNSEADFTFLPIIARTNPPIACVGLTENQAIEQGYEVKIGLFPFGGNGFATLVGKKEGLVKIVIDKTTELVLGVHIIGMGAVELITSGVIALEMMARAEDLSFPLYPHPSTNEGLLEAIEATFDKAIHIAPKRKKDKALF